MMKVDGHVTQLPFGWLGKEQQKEEECDVDFFDRSGDPAVKNGQAWRDLFDGSGEIAVKKARLGGKKR